MTGGPDRVPLSDLLSVHPEEHPVTPFRAMVDDREVTVVAILERTVVIQSTASRWDRRLVKMSAPMIEPARLTWEPGYQPQVPDETQRKKRLAITDRRALRTQGKL